MTDHASMTDEQLTLSKEAIEAEEARRAGLYGEACLYAAIHLPGKGEASIKPALIAAWPHMPETKALQERIAELEAQIAGPIVDADEMAQPDDGWIEHDGGPCPVPEHTKVYVQFCDRTITAPFAECAKFWEWYRHHNTSVFRYRIADARPVKGQDDE